MNALLESVARWLDRSDTGDLTAVIFTFFGSIALAAAGVACLLNAIAHR